MKSKTPILILTFILVVTTPITLILGGKDNKSSQANLKRIYINQYVLLIDWISRADRWIISNYNDSQLCKLAHKLSKIYLEEANKLIPPEELKPIHPHFLMVMENMERALYYCATEDKKQYLKFRRIVLEEQKIIDELLIQLHITIPTIE